MGKRGPEPEVSAVSAVLLEHARCTTQEVADAVGFSYDSTRRVLERYAVDMENLGTKAAGERLFRKVYLGKGKRRFSWERIDLGIGDHADDYPPGWMGSKSNAQLIADSMDADEIELTLEDEFGVDNETEIDFADGETETFEIRVRGKRLGEISELELGKAIRYQVTSPFEPKTYERFSEALEVLREKTGRDDRPVF
jgi:hypothetical protein